MRLEVPGGKKKKNREDGKRCQANFYHCSAWFWFLITHQHVYVNSRIRHQPCLLKCPWWPFLAQFPLSFWLCLALGYSQNNLDLSLTPCLTLTHLSPPPETWGVQQLFSHRRKLSSEHSFHNAFVVKKKKKIKLCALLPVWYDWGRHSISCFWVPWVLRGRYVVSFTHSLPHPKNAQGTNLCHACHHVQMTQCWWI